MPHEIKLIDAIEGLKSLDSKSVDLIVTDPAYSSLEKWRDQGTTTRLKDSKSSSNAWFPTVPNDYFVEFFDECYRVLKSGTDMYIMCDEGTGDFLKSALRTTKFELRKSLIWHKVGKEIDVKCPQCGIACDTKFSPGTPGMGYPFRSSWEMIVHARKGKRPAPADKTLRNVLTVPWIKGKGAYPTQKPVDLILPLLKQSSEEGELVLDPFAGSGSTGEAAFRMGRNFLGFDVQQESLDFFAQRKRSWSLPFDGVPEELEEPDRKSILSFFRKKG